MSAFYTKDSMNGELLSISELHPNDVFSIGDEKFLVIKNTCGTAAHYKGEYYDITGSGILSYYNNDGQQCCVICLNDLSMVPPNSLKKYKVIFAGKFTGFKYNKIETEEIDE
jgi:hypothetical protein